MKSTEIHQAPKEIFNLFTYFSALVACFAAVIIGYDAGFIGGCVTLPEFVSEFSFDTKSASTVLLQKSNVISLFHAGAFFGSYAIYPIAIYWGRIWGFKIAAIFITVGSAIQLAASSSVGLGPMYAGRFISGFGIGSVSNLAPMYVSEIAPTAIRGRLVGMYEIAWQVGGVVGFFINYGTNQHVTGPPQWQIPVAVQLIPAGLFAIGVFFIPESPRWYFTKNDRDKALKSLCRLRKLDANHEYISYEIAMMLEEAMHRQQYIKNEFWDPFKYLLGVPEMRKRLLMCLVMFIFQNSTGINAINYYSVQILQTIGISSTSSGLLSTGVFGLIKGLCCFIWAFFVIDRFGRKTSILASAWLCIISLYYLGAYIKIADPANTLNGGSDAGSRSALAFFYLWTVGYAFSWSGLPWVYMSEVFDSKVRNLAQCFTASSNWFWAFILARWTLKMITAMKYGSFFFFASLSLISLVIYIIFYPETKDIPITDVDLLFEKGVSPWKAHARALQILKDRESHDIVGSGVDEQKAFVEIVENTGKKSPSDSSSAEMV